MKENESWRTSGPIAVVLAILALLGFRTLTSDSPNPSGEQATSHRDHTVQEEGDERKDKANGDRGGRQFWQPLRDFITARAPGGLAKAIANLPDDQVNIDGWDMHSLIACVPDPITSTSGHRFDGLIDAIQRAAETQGYVYDRSYYPWRNKKGAKVTTDGTLTEGKPGSRHVHLLAQSVSHKREDQASSGEPGLLLLRCKKDGCRRLLLVFLVGETATAGLDKEAFASSLEFIKKLKRYRDKREVLVLGPHFSGSQTSLQLAIEAFAAQEMWYHLWANPIAPLQLPTQLFAYRPTFQIISGNASSIVKHELENGCPLARVKFQATVLPGKAILDALYEYLNLGNREGEEYHFRDNFAILCESNTVFGQSVKPKRKADCDCGPTLFPFPLHVSEVRRAYNKLTGPTRDNTIRLPSFGSKLQLPTRPSNPAQDAEVSLNPAMTAVMSERLLTQMLETIAHERFRYVFIVATDIQDRLFLAGLVREQCPESRLVFFDTDLLFTHPDYSSVLRGSIVGSSYPLYSRSQRWSFPFNDRSRPFFPGPGEQGYYNAAVLLLGQDQPPPDYKSLIEYGPPFPKLYPSSAPPPASECTEQEPSQKKSIKSASSEIDKSRPPVWISIVGVGGLYPVAVIPNRLTNDRQGNEQDNYKDYVYPVDTNVQKEAEFRISHSGQFIVPVLGMTLLLIYVTACYIAVLVRWPQWQSGTAPRSGPHLQKLFWPRSRRLRWRQKLYAAVCLTSVLVVYGYLVFVWLLPLGHGLLKDSPVQVKGWQWITPVVLLGVLGFVVLTGVVRLVLGGVSWYRKHGKSHGFLRQIFGEPPVILIAAALLIPLVCFLAVNEGWPRLWQPGEALLFADRATTLANGVSPVVPILALGLAFFAWSYAQLNRLYLYDNQTAINPCPPGDDPFPQVAFWHVEATRDVRRPKQALLPRQTPSTDKGIYLFWFIWIMLFFAFSRLSVYFVPAVEGIVTEALILVSLTVLSTLIVYGWLHLWKLWGSLRQLLNALALLPLRMAYPRIPTAITHQLGQYFFQLQSYFFFTKPEHRSLQPYRLDQHRLLVADYPSIAAALNAAAVIPAHLQTNLANTLQPAASDLTSTTHVCFSLLQHIHHHPHLAEQLLEQSAEEKKDHPCPCPREADYSLNIHKTVKTASRRNNLKQKIHEKIRPEFQVEPALRHWLTRVEDFVALEVAVYISQFFAQLCNLAIYLSVIPILLLLAVTSYPFQPQRLWLLLSVTLIGIVTVSILWIIFQIERNEMVSRIMKTTPNQLNFHWAFLSHILLYAVPLLGILVAMSSDVSDLVHSWIDPLLQLMK